MLQATQLTTSVGNNYQPRTLDEAIVIIESLRRRVQQLEAEYETLCAQVTATAVMLGATALETNICRQCAANRGLKARMFCAFEVNTRCDSCGETHPVTNISNYERE